MVVFKEFIDTCLARRRKHDRGCERAGMRIRCVLDGAICRHQYLAVRLKAEGFARKIALNGQEVVGLAVNGERLGYTSQLIANIDF